MIIAPVHANQIITTGYFPDAETAFTDNALTSLTYTVNSSQAIALVQFQAPKGTVLNYTIYYGSGGILTGSISYVAGNVDFYGYGQGVTTITIGSNSSTRSFVDTGLLKKWEIVGYAREQTDDGKTLVSSGFAITDVSAGGFQTGFMAYEPVSSVQPIEGISFTSTKPVWVDIGTSNREEIQKGISKTAIDEMNEWLTLILNIGGTIYEYATGLLYLIQFIFIENFWLMVSLYIALTAAISFGQTRDVFKAIRKFIGYQKAFIEFLITLYNALIDAITKMLSAL